MLMQQFFGKTFWVTLAAVAAVHLVAVPAQHQQVLSLVALGVVFAATAAVSWCSLAAGLCVAFAEIMVGGHGHLLEAAVGGMSVSVRMAVFAAVMGVWLVQLVRGRVRPVWQPYRDVPFAILGLAVAVGTLVGFVQHAPANVFDDMNGFLTLAYLLPLASLPWTNAQKRDLLQVLAASVVWIGVSTLALVYLFTHLPGKFLGEVYAFVRDARLAEVTLLKEPTWFVQLLPNPWYFRVFEPAHFFSMVMLFVLIGARFILYRDGKMGWAARALFVLVAATFVASLSRSFMVGLAAGGFATTGFILFDRLRPFGRTLRHALQALVLFAVGAVAFWAVIAVPVPPQPDLRDAAFYREDTGYRGGAVSSRWNLLWPMFDAIMDNPVVGAGFGKEVTFISDDQRIRDMNPSGAWTTYRFEWGYQDIWLKMGLLGLIGFIAYVICVTQAFVYTFRTQGHRWIAIGLFAGLVALFATHVFSPYLNHPIGLGYMLFVLPFFDWVGLQRLFAAAEVKERASVKNVGVRSPVPVMERK